MLSDLLASIKRAFGNLLTPRRVTPSTIRMAYAVGATIDAAQFLLGPFGWAGLDQGLDVIAMVAISRLLGFHPLLLPTFVLEFVPFTDLLPTWTGCVALVVRARRQQGLVSAETADGHPVIDTRARRVE